MSNENKTIFDKDENGRPTVTRWFSFYNEMYVRYSIKLTVGINEHDNYMSKIAYSDETPTIDDCEEYDFDNEYESEQFANRITRDWEYFTEYWVEPELTQEEKDYLTVD